MAQKGYKRAMTITWNYAAGNEMVKGFTEAFEKGGGKVMKDLSLPFPGVEFQALLTEIAAQKPDAVFAFFAGGGAVKFVKDYDAAGLNKTIPLFGSGFLTDGTLEAQGTGGARADDLAALWRRHRHAAQHGLPQQVRRGLQGQPRRLCDAGLRRGTAAGRGPDRGEGRRQKRDAMLGGDEEGHDRQPARQVDDEPAAQPDAGLLRPRGQGQLQRGHRRGGEGAGRPGRGCRM